VACSNEPTREWVATDHDHEDPTKSQTRQVPKTQVVDDEAEITELAWDKNCSRCHGASGEGDGPQGPSVQAPDLTRTEFLAATSDATIEQTIRNGRGKMPAFGTLPDRAVQGLIKRIRGKGHL